MLPPELRFLLSAGAPPQRTAPGKRKSPAPPQSRFGSEPERGMQAGVPSDSGPTNRRYSPDPVLPVSCTSHHPPAPRCALRPRRAQPKGPEPIPCHLLRQGASPPRPARTQPEPAALQAAPPGAPQPLRAPQPGQGKRHEQPLRPDTDLPFPLGTRGLHVPG